MTIFPESDSALAQAAHIIQKGGVVAHATETCYGFACDLTNSDAVQKLFAIKQRPEGMPVSALFASVEEAKEWVEWNALADDLARAHLPGPLTVVLKVASSKLQVPTLGIRVSSHPVAQRLAKLCDVPLSTTSANLHGEANPYTIDAIPECDLIIDSGQLPRAEPSTVVSLADGTIQILRQGSIDPTPYHLLPSHALPQMQTLGYLGCGFPCGG